MSEQRNLRAAGAAAEDRAADFLLAKGYTLVTRRRKVRGGEIDLVCLDGEVLVFVEVKFRLAPDYRPEESLGATKASRMRTAARSWVEACGDDGRIWRFDLVAIDRAGLRHYENVLGE